MKILFVVNPASGGTSKDLLLPLLRENCRVAGIRPVFFFTEGYDDFTGLSKEIDILHPQKVIAVGGDGTIQLVARVLLHRNIQMGVIPTGSANGMAAELGIPMDVEQALSLIISAHEIVHMDMICLNQHHYCIHIGDIGLNAMVIEEYARNHQRGMAAYGRYLLSALMRAQKMHYEIWADDNYFSLSGYMLAFANAQKYGTGVVLNPKGKINDGFFELCNLREIALEGGVAAGLSIFNADYVENYIDIISCQSAQIRLAMPTMLQVDGELVGRVHEISAEVIPAAIPIILPQDEHADLY